MSVETAAVGPSDDHGHGHGHGPDSHDAPHGTFESYVTGFVLSVILTAIPFFLVMSGLVGSGRLTAFLVLGCAVIQIIVHMIYFLHMNSKSEGGWTMLALIFTIIVVVIALAGSLWVMYHLNTNMMPTHDMTQMVG